MKYIFSNYEFNFNLDGLKNNTVHYGVIIDNNRHSITKCIAPYCSMCGGTNRCGGSCIG
jgi:hypothetical protein